jgi:hypothetical protein
MDKVGPTCQRRVSERLSRDGRGSSDMDLMVQEGVMD